MPTFRFKGFATASAIAITAVQGATTASGSVSQWGVPSGGASISISIYGDDVRDANNAWIAPVGVWFEATPSGFAVEPITMPDHDLDVTPGTDGTVQVYDPAFHEIYYYWTVTRPEGASATFSTDGLNLPDVWNNRNVASGQQVAFCFDEPGNYTVSCFAVDEEGNSATASVTFQSGGTKPAIKDPNTEFAGALTICCNPAGDPDFTWAPSGAQQFYDYADDWTCAQAAAAAYENGGDGVRRRFLLKPGATYDFRGASGTLIDTDAFVRHHVGGGAGTKPTVLCSGAYLVGSPNTSPNAASVKVYNVAWQGGWRQDSETGRDIIANPIFSKNAICHWTIHQISQSGTDFGGGVTHSIGQYYANSYGCIAPFVFSECSWRHGREYLCYSGQIINSEDPKLNYPDISRAAWIGCSMADDPDAIDSQTTGSIDNCRNGTTFFRWEHIDRTYIGACDFFNQRRGNQYIIRGGTYPLTKPNEDPGGLGARHRMKWPRNNFERVMAEGGAGLGMSHYAGNTGDGSTAYNTYGFVPGNTVVDGVIYLATHQFSMLFGIENNYGCALGTTVRNLMAVIPAHTTASGVSLNSYMFPLIDNSTATHALYYAQPLRISNIAWVNLRTTAQNENGVKGKDVYSTTTATNRGITVSADNLWKYAPNWNVPLTSTEYPFTTISAIAAGVTPRCKGPAWNVAHFPITLSSVADDAEFTVLYADIPTVDSGGRSIGAVSQTYWTVDHTDHNDHSINNGSTRYSVLGGGIEVKEYNATGIVFYNRTGSVLNGTWYCFIDRRALLLGANTSEATPDTMPLIWRSDDPTTAATTLPRDMLGNARDAVSAIGPVAAVGEGT